MTTRSTPPVTPSKLRLVAYLQIALQLAFPVLASVTPSQAAEMPVLSAKAKATAKKEAFRISSQYFKRGHKIVAGETLAQLAERANVDLATLRELNRALVPNDRDFYALSAGDNIMLPLWQQPTAFSANRALPSVKQAELTVNSQSIPTYSTNTVSQPLPTFSVEQTQSVTQEELDKQATALFRHQYEPAPVTETERQAAEWATRFAGVQASENRNDAAKTMVANSASTAATQQLEGWLNRFGNARLSIVVNDRLDITDGSADLLFPLYDNGRVLTYSQLGVHDRDGYTTLNMGLGQRWFTDQQMAGYNLFVDQELRNKHTRIGAGVEFWRDYLKLSGNMYLPLTQWKESKEIANYDERPATGYDLRADGYLPSHPQLGGKLMFEQYFGNEVALFGYDKRQDYPYAFTIGMNYTPVPLVTAGVDYKQGRAGENNALFNLQFNYAFGVPWQQQISADSVAARRTLLGSRLDFVERNNNIVMQYRRNETIRLTLPAQLDGKTGALLNITATVETKNTLKEVIWDSAALVAAGGKLTKIDETHAQVILPLQEGTYFVNATATDNLGNRSQPATTRLVAKAPLNASVLTIVSPETAVADDNAVLTYELTAVDQANQPLTGKAVTWSTNLGTIVDPVTTTDEQGKATVSLKSPTVGPVKLTATFEGISKTNGEGSFTSVAPPAEFEILLEAYHNKQYTDNAYPPAIDGNQLTVTVTEAGEPVTVETDLVWKQNTCGASCDALPAKTDNTGVLETNLKMNTASTGVKKLEVCLKDDETTCAAVDIEFFQPPVIKSYKTKNEAVVSSSQFTGPRLKQGTINITAAGGDGTFSWANAVATADTKIADVTLTSATQANPIATAFSTDPKMARKATFTIPTTSKWVTVSGENSTPLINYTAAESYCTTALGSALSSQADGDSIRNVWGNIQSYNYVNPNAWVKGTLGGAGNPDGAKLYNFTNGLITDELIASVHNAICLK